MKQITVYIGLCGTMTIAGALVFSYLFGFETIHLGMISGALGFCIGLTATNIKNIIYSIKHEV
jgi:hypothetical protein